MRKRTYKKAVDSLTCDGYILQPYTKIRQPFVEGSLLPEELLGYISDLQLSEDRHRFDSTKDAHSALNIFIKCIEKGYYPPIEILTFISSKFKKYFDSDDSIGLTMGLNKLSKKAYKNNYRDIEIVIEIDTLRYLFKVNLEIACDAVARRYEENGNPLGGSYIQEIYNKKGKTKLVNSLMTAHDDIRWMDEWSEEFKSEKKKEMLNRYPSDVSEELLSFGGK